MVKTLETVEMPSPDEFVERFVARNEPVVISGLDFDPQQWTPDAMTSTAGDLTALVYGALFDLDDVQSLSDYVETWFGIDTEDEEEVPYVRWYNKLRDVDFHWGDQAFERVAQTWSRPHCLPTDDYIVPVGGSSGGADPVVDQFPYRGLLVAARGARTRLHRDPFCTDAVVAQFFGVKEAALYAPGRAADLSTQVDGTSFGGFVDVRETDPDTLSVEPDFHGFINPGEMIYIPHGWLHDVIVREDSVSVTWNFIHRRGASEFREYLRGNWQGDPEFEVLQYFHRSLGKGDLSADEIAGYHFN